MRFGWVVGAAAAECLEEARCVPSSVGRNWEDRVAARGGSPRWPADSPRVRQLATLSSIPHVTDQSEERGAGS